MKTYFPTFFIPYFSISLSCFFPHSWSQLKLQEKDDELLWMNKFSIADAIIVYVDQVGIFYYQYLITSFPIFLFHDSRISEVDVILTVVGVFDTQKCIREHLLNSLYWSSHDSKIKGCCSSHDSMRTNINWFVQQNTMLSASFFNLL